MNRTVDYLFENSIDIFDEIKSCLFIKALANGSLDRKKFEYYLYQDSFYLKYYAKALGILSKNAKDEKASKVLNYLMMDGVALETEMQKDYFAIFEKLNFKKDLNFISYGKTLIINAVDYSLGLASIFPCFYIYQKLFLYVDSISTSKLYDTWIKTYCGEDFASQVNSMKILLEHAMQSESEERVSEMAKIFRFSCSYELKLMNSTWNLGKNF